MEPTIKEFATEKEGELKVLKVDVDKNPAVAQKYNIRGVPTLILFHKGNIVWQQSGVVPKHTLEDVFENYSTKQ